MGIEGSPDSILEASAAKREELKRKIAAMHDRIKSSYSLKREELASVYSEGRKVEQDQEKLNVSIAQVEADLAELNALNKQAEELQISPESNDELKELLFDMQEDQNRLTIRHNNLMDLTHTLSTTPGVMDSVHEEALAENEKVDREKQIKEALNSAVMELRDNLQKQLTDNDQKAYYGAIAGGAYSFAEELANIVKKALKESERVGETMLNLPKLNRREAGGFESVLRGKIEIALENSKAVKEYFKLKEELS